jgi:hypothetical protein
MHSKGARASAASNPVGAARPALMRRAAHAVESKAVVRIEVAVSPRPCLGCAVEPALRVAPLRRGVPPRSQQPPYQEGHSSSCAKVAGAGFRMNSLIVLFNREACQSLVVICTESVSQGALRFSCKRKALWRKVILAIKALQPIYTKCVYLALCIENRVPLFSLFVLLESAPLLLLGRPPEIRGGRPSERGDAPFPI